MNLSYILIAIIGGTIVYFALHGACPIYGSAPKHWLENKKKEIDKKLQE